MGKRSITISDKLKIVTRAKNCESLHSLHKATGYQRNQIRIWIRNEEALLLCSKESRRTKGGGRKLEFPQIETNIINWFKVQRKKKLIVNYRNLRREAMRLAKEKDVQNFKCSNKWIRNVCKRNNIASRKVTNQSQDDNSTMHDKHVKACNYLENVKIKTAGLLKNQIYNMDETGCYFDMNFGFW